MKKKELKFDLANCIPSRLLYNQRKNYDRKSLKEIKKNKKSFLSRILSSFFKDIKFNSITVFFLYFHGILLSPFFFYIKLMIIYFPLGKWDTQKGEILEIKIEEIKWPLEKQKKIRV